MKIESFELGKGEPILFLGGAFTTFRYYGKFFKLLAKEYKVYFFNYPGFGKSETFKNGYSVENYLKAIDEFITKQKLKEFHLAGASFGGYLAVHYLHTRKNKGIKSLLLFSPMTKLRSKNTIKNIFALAQENLGDKIKYRKRSLVISGFNLYNFNNLREKLKHGIFVQRCSFDKNVIPQNVPILIVVGEKDNLVDVQYTISTFRQRSKMVELVSFSNFGHEAFVVIGDEILKIIKDFTDKL